MTMISYDNFWNTLKKKKITQYSLIKDYKVSTGLLNRMRHNEPISLATVETLCTILKCRVQDIVDVTPDPRSLKT